MSNESKCKLRISFAGVFADLCYSARSRVYFDIEIAEKKEGRITFELVSTCTLRHPRNPRNPQSNFPSSTSVQQADGEQYDDGRAP